MNNARQAWAEKMDRRKTRRVRIKLEGKIFLPGLAQESDCIVLDLSSGGAAIRCKQAPPAKSKVVLYVNGFGRMEGVTAQPTKEGTRIYFDYTPRKRQRIEEQLTLFVQEGPQSDTALRGGTRVPYVEITNFTRPDGDVVDCEILDISLSGVSLKTETRPPVNEHIRIGRMVGRVTRHHETGVGIVFVGQPSLSRKGIPDPAEEDGPRHHAQTDEQPNHA